MIDSFYTKPLKRDCDCSWPEDRMVDLLRIGCWMFFEILIKKWFFSDHFFHVSYSSVSLDTQGLARSLQRERERDSLSNRLQKLRQKSTKNDFSVHFCVHTPNIFRNFLPQFCFFQCCVLFYCLILNF